MTLAHATGPGHGGRLRRARRWRLAIAAGAAAVSVVLLTGSLHGDPAVADANDQGSSRSQAAAVTPGAGLALSSEITIAGLSLPTQLNQLVVTPIVNALVALPNAMAADLTNGLVGAGYAASNGDTPQPRPSSGSYPTCGERGWTSSNCYSADTPSVTQPVTVPGTQTTLTSVVNGTRVTSGTTTAPVSLSPLTLSTATAQGYATSDSSGYAAGSRTAHPQLTVLGFPLGDLGVISSSAACRTTATACTLTQSFTDTSLAGGKLALSLANGGSTLAAVNNVPVGAAAVPISMPNFPLTKVSVNGNLATITVGLNLTQLLSALNLPNVLSSVPGAVLVDDGSTATMTIKVGPGALSAANPASAWGMDVSVDLTTAIKLKVSAAGLLTLGSVTITGTSTPPSLVGLKLAFSAAAPGLLPPSWVPPAVI